MPDSSALNNDGAASGTLRPRILDVAARLFAELGYTETSMRAVAEAAGCTKPALYYHFGSKDALFGESVRAQSARYSELIGEGYATQGTVRERLIAAMTLYFDFIRAEPHSLRLVYRSMLSPDEGQPSLDPAHFRDAPISLTSALIQEGMEAGEVRADLNLEDAILALLGMVDQRGRHLVFEGEAIPDNCAGRLVDIFFNGVSS
jgi:AcrR family transcriptional regulator